jgi:hypothetical protein
MVQTPNIKLEKPAEGTRPWTDAVNGNWDKIDEAVKSNIDAIDACALQDLSNLSAEGNKVIASLAVPSTSMTVLSFPSNGVTLTAPTDGYFTLIGKSADTDAFMRLVLYSGDSTEPYMCVTTSATTGRAMALFMPVRAGGRVYFNYGSLTGDSFTPKKCIFCKLKGAV